ncbi:protein ANTAGONIST OF LIKE HETEROCHROMATIN PROTEIN 1 [Thrips palmi]|uniref:Protein ANTAGONIST OF LIKE HETEROCHROMATIN PROTEIN 1 n=1 Tax=Thrips palmi TaxID=161013 RepID=A0A6P8Z609_THRPL|nr:protein ANTAGONIST OF LIKE HETEROCHROMATIN PROTEIN 1 [Thrips palmi]
MDIRLIALMTICVTIVSVHAVQMLVLLAVRQRFARRRALLCRELDFQRRLFLRRRRRRIVALLASKRRRKQGVKRSTSSHWWDKTVPLFSDKEWLENFRVRKGTFDWICSRVHDLLAPQPNPVIAGQALSVEKIVAIGLYKLAHVAEYLVIGNLFGVCKSTVHNCLYAFCYAVTEELGDTFIRFPDAEEAAHISRRFEEMSNIPQLIGAIDGSHIPITPPREGNSDFINRKTYHSLVLQGIVDDQYLFRDISCKMPGACHDADVLRDSTFYKNHDKLMPKGTRNVNGMDIPYMIMGDPAYPLMPWLLKNYTYDKNTTPVMDSFNVYMNKARVVVENAFGRLKARWRILGRRSDINYKFVPRVEAACCILHNICELSKETFHNRWLAALREDEREFPQPDTIPHDTENQYDAVDIRDHLMLYLSEKCEVLTSSRGRCVQQS